MYLKWRATPGILLSTTRSLGVVTVLYTPGQLRSAVAISPETYRHWKRALRPLRRDSGHSPCFRAGDLIAVAVVRALTVDLGIRVGALSPIAEMLFDICNTTSWLGLERGSLLLDLANARTILKPESEGVIANGPIMVLPLRTVVSRLRDLLLAEGNRSEAQEMLRFPPTPMRSRAEPAHGRGRR